MALPAQCGQGGFKAYATKITFRSQQPKRECGAPDVSELLMYIRNDTHPNNKLLQLWSLLLYAYEYGKRNNKHAYTGQTEQFYTSTSPIGLHY